MSGLWSWLSAQRDAVHVPLFDADEHGVVSTRLIGRGKDRRVLNRSAQMEEAMIEMVEAGLDEDGWRGVLYIMGWGPIERFRPLYIGKAGKAGKKPGVISANLKRLRTSKNKFARWGDGGTAYHVGSLSTAIFTDRAFTTRPKYERWAEMLFRRTGPPTLREATSLIIIPWRDSGTSPTGAPMSLEQLEECLIDIALDEFDDVLLNVQGETWWSTQASVAARPAVCLEPRLPVTFAADAAELSKACDALAGQSLLALDVETEWLSQYLCLIQVGTAERTYLFDALALEGQLGPFGALMRDQSIIKVIHNASFEKRVLRSVGIEIRGAYDTYRASERIFGRKRGRNKLSAVCERVLGLPMDKTEQQSAWQLRPLTGRQRAYAALDAEVLIAIYERFAALDAAHPANGLFA